MAQPTHLLRSPKKRFHLQHSSELEDTLTLSKTLEPTKESKTSLFPVTYSRSTSLPARSSDSELSRSDSKSNTESGNETEVPDRSQSDGALVKTGHDSSTVDQQTLSTSKTAFGCNVQSSSKPAILDDPTIVSSPMDISVPVTPQDVKMESVNTTPEIEVPKSFNFTELNQSNEEVQDTKCSKSLSLRSPSPKAKDVEDKNGVFVFSAMSPTSPEQVVVKRKNAAVSFKFDPEVIESEERVVSGGVRGEAGEDEMVLLAQQLELDSDTVSGFYVCIVNLCMYCTHVCVNVCMVVCLCVCVCLKFNNFQ